MTLIILAAGFATRLEPRTLNIPKHLLPLKDGRVVIDLFVESISDVVADFRKIVLVTNQKYYTKFSSWAKSTPYEIEIISDKVDSKDKRIGAIGDLLFVIDKCKINDDMLICAADYILKSADFKKYINFSKGKSTTIVKKEDDTKALKLGSCMQLGDNCQITRFVEKPADPFSNLFGVPYYYLVKSDFDHIRLIPKNLHDNIGQLVAKLVDDSKIFAYKYSGNIVHLTTEQDYLSLLNEITCGERSLP